MLEDGTYDVVVVDAEPLGAPEGAIRIEVTVLAGAHKGELVAVAVAGLRRDPLDLLAVPGTLVVVDGHPDLALEG